MTDEEKAREIIARHVKMAGSLQKAFDRIAADIAVALKEAQERGYKQGVEATRLNLAEKEALRGLQND